MRRPIWAHEQTVDSADCSAVQSVHPTCVGVGRSAQCSAALSVYRVSGNIVSTVQLSSTVPGNLRM